MRQLHAREMERRWFKLSWEYQGAVWFLAVMPSFGHAAAVLTACVALWFAALIAGLRGFYWRARI